MNVLVRSIAAEFLRYKSLAEGALAQVGDADLVAPGPSAGNSLATICWHVSGNLQSRFTDFLTSDGEKPWRRREEEFAARRVSREELLSKWGTGWNVLSEAIDGLTDADLTRQVTIRKQSLAVHEAMHRSLAHVSYHVGQIVYLSHSFAGPAWKYLSIAPGESAAYNANPGSESPAAQAEAIARRTGNR